MKKYKVTFYNYFDAQIVEKIYNSNSIIFKNEVTDILGTPIINNIFKMQTNQQIKIKGNKNEIDVTNYFIQAIKGIFIITKDYI